MENLVEIKDLNLIKWTLKLTERHSTTQASKTFTIQDRKCTFFFYSGYSSDNDPLSLSIDFDKKEKFNPPVHIAVVVSSTSKMHRPENHSITGDKKQKIWSSSEYSMRGKFLIIGIVVQDALLKGLLGDKSVQTSPYIDTQFSLERYSKDFDKLLDEGLHHDVEFTFGEQTIKAHKNILCCRSDVFTSMLRSDMVEGKTGSVNIKDMDATIFQQFLRCLYTGRLPELTVDIVVKLYAASDKYAVDTLKLQCADFLIGNMSLENACEMLVLADRHNDPEFKKVVIDYLFKEEMPIVGEKWSDFCCKNQNLAIEVLNLFCQELRQKCENFQKFK